MTAQPKIDDAKGIEADLIALDRAKDTWAQSTVTDRMAVLRALKSSLNEVAEEWVRIATGIKRIPDDTPYAGEEWMSGPYAVMSWCNAMMTTLSQIEGKAYLRDLPKRLTASGQVAVQVLPHAIADRIVLSGVTAEVWMQPKVTRQTLVHTVATAYDTRPENRRGAVALVLGAGNINAIAPLDCLHKLFSEHQVVVLKLNPVNAALADVLRRAMAPLIARDALRIVTGNGAVGAALADHALVSELHITGSQATHDRIVWGQGEEAARNRAAGVPRNPRRITSELGAVCPTIVVPGPWSRADIAFQGEHLATQKLHNSGFNCIACQTLILPSGWAQKDALLDAMARAMAHCDRPAWYPGADDRIARASTNNGTGNGSGALRRVMRGRAPDVPVIPIDTRPELTRHEVFAPVLATKDIDETDPEAFLIAAIDYANTQLHGTLGANILIHPRTIAAIGPRRFEELLADLRYGTIAVNAWTGLAFLLAQCPWGAFPGHRLDDVQSGIGSVHNTYLFDQAERCVIRGPWRPFPRSFLSGEMTLMPRPPWFVTHRHQDKVGRALTRFAYRPRWRRLPSILVNALAG